MPIARIRTSDPEAISFLAAKLAESGFQVQFAHPGERLAGEVDLEITVNRSNKVPLAPKRSLVPSNEAMSSNGVENWTTPYHVEAPEISDAPEPSDECEGLDIPWNDRELARILATGSKGVRVESLVIEEEPTEGSASSTFSPSAALRIVEAPEPPEPTVKSYPPAPRLAPQSVHRPELARSFSQHSLQRRFASVAAMVTLAVTAVFSLAWSGDRFYPSQETSTPRIELQSHVPPPPNLTSTLRLASTNLNASGATSSIETAATLTNNEPPQRRAVHKKKHARRAAQTRRVPPAAKVPPSGDDQEVIVRHFPAADER